MRILLCNDHRYPAAMFATYSGGRAQSRLLDYLAKGLAELGHQVLYQLDGGVEFPLPEGVEMAPADPWLDADVIHNQKLPFLVDGAYLGKPWVRTCHVDLMMHGYQREALPVSDNWIFVSRTLAQTYGYSRWIHNGIDPADCIYSDTKRDYFLFICCLNRAWEKGLATALALCEEVGFELVIAGETNLSEKREAIVEACRGKNVRLVGEVMGTEKAELFAAARALLFPTERNESFGLVIAEALMSGTPVICSDRGACPEIVSTEVGFVCSTRQDYLRAIAQIDRIRSADCRQKAMNDYHYLRMARQYVSRYEEAVERFFLEETRSVLA